MNLIYTGIGSRKTPMEVTIVMTSFAKKLCSLGYILRSGGAEGADSAFELGATRKEIYLPWREFNDNPSLLYIVCPRAMKMASELHPAWGKLSLGAKKLQARNCYQILGTDLETPSQFVLCWTPDGCEKSSERTNKTGGTGQAIDLADLHGIPVFNLYREDALMRVKDFILSEWRKNK